MLGETPRKQIVTCTPKGRRPKPTVLASGSVVRPQGTRACAGACIQFFSCALLMCLLVHARSAVRGVLRRHRTWKVESSQASVLVASVGDILWVSCDGDFQFFLGIPLVHPTSWLHQITTSPIHNHTQPCLPHRYSVTDVALGLRRADHLLDAGISVSTVSCPLLSTVAPAMSNHIRADPSHSAGLGFSADSRRNLGLFRGTPYMGLNGRLISAVHRFNGRWRSSAKSLRSYC